MNTTFFEDVGFCGDADDYYNIANSSISAVRHQDL